MRIAQVVTVVTPEGAYGGPVRVAVNQAKALIAKGHEVTIFAGTRGFQSPPTEIDGVPVRLFRTVQAIPRAGFAGMSSPGLLRAVHREVRRFDMWHIHLARDLVTLPAAAIVRNAKAPYVVQCHGMIDESSNPLAVPLDAALTRPVLRDARRILSLTPREESDLRKVGGPHLVISRIPNGVPRSHPPAPGSSGRREALFLARLQKRKRPQLFVEAAVQIAGRFRDVQFTLIGPDEGEGRAVQDRIDDSGHADRIVWSGALPPEATLERMRSASVYVLPSVDEPFPMSVLEALSVGLPVIITDTCGLAPFVRAAEAGVVIDDSQESLTLALESLLTDEALARRMGGNGRELIERDFSIDSVATLLAGHYDTALSAAARY
ncbi:glycosyltransferase [Cryobacterium adonitolivorans]|uniref:Glycosyltransferase n=1 Tax=Cryobacterium adonitolivorans TaxID=1259189 RepID=A0A4R8WAM7_9MICO|nr:glycosyltransferase [Cryobacterium adonitolivorans]TFC05565.1 glycosyltransferase [Cryobacterium adonitolivorans]